MRDTTISRRGFLKGSVVAAGLFGIPAWTSEMNEAPPADFMSFHLTGFPMQWTAPAGLNSVDPAMLALNRLAFGPRPGDVERVRAQGVDNYVEEQLSPQSIDDSAMDMMLKQFPSLTMSAVELAKTYGDALLQRRVKGILDNQGMSVSLQSAIEGFLRLFGVGGDTSGGGNSAPQTNPLAILVQVIQATVLRQMYSERQLFEMMVDFWSNHFNIYIVKNECRFLKTVDDRDVIRKNALGKFRDLLFASAHSPAMLVFLDNVTNVRGVPNENYARELMELHTLSVNGGYTQTDVQEVARCFTGWTVSTAKRGLIGPDYSSAGEFDFRVGGHDAGEKRVLGVSIPPGGGITDGEQVVDILARHPSTAQFVSTKLVRRFVSDNPPDRLVASAADTFLKSEGDIGAVMSTILHSDEFLQSFGQKAKRPLEYIASAVRALGASETTGVSSGGANGKGKMGPPYAGGNGGVVAQALRLMGQVPFMWQAPNGYPDVADAWINSNNLLARWNLALSLTGNKAAGFHVDLNAVRGADSSSPEASVDFWTRRILNRSIPDADRAKLVAYLDSDVSHKKIEGLVALILASPHFQYK
jgi:uncharacterized protein (DUF1800 family)